MVFDLAFVGGGIGSNSGLINFLEKARIKNVKKKFTICVIDEQIENIPGGIAYSKNLSISGFFNNPCRLSPSTFVKWCLINKNKKKLINFLNNQKSLSFLQWLKQNKSAFYQAKKLIDLGEVYFPRVFYSLFLEDQLIKEIKKINKNIKLFFLQSKIKGVKKKDNVFILKSHNKIIKFTGKYKGEKLVLEKKNFLNSKNISAKNIFLSMGLPSPKKLVPKNVSKNKFYISDLYKEGGARNLLNLIEIKSKNNKCPTVHFLGAKAGFLESLPEIKQSIIKKKIKVKIISTSRNAETLNPATFSKNKNIIKLKFFKNKELRKIRNSEQLLRGLVKEFKYAEKNSFLKYDVWTKILKNKCFSKIFKNFSKKELKRYNEIYFQKIREITRFTYPETVSSYNFLKQKGVIKMDKAKIMSIKRTKNNFNLKTNNKNKSIISSDILVSVLGPENTLSLIKSEGVYKDIYDLNKKEINKDGYVVNKNFQLKNQKNVYLPGFLSSGYNSQRQTIIKAITENSIKASNHLFRKYKY